MKGRNKDLKEALGIGLSRYDLRVINAVESLGSDDPESHEICLKFGVDVEYGTQGNGFSNIKFSV